MNKPGFCYALSGLRVLKRMEQPHAQSVECVNDTSRSYEEYQDDLEQYERERHRTEDEQLLEGEGK